MALLDNLSFRHKLWLPLGAVLLAVVAASTVAAFKIKHRMLDDRVASLRQIVETAHGIAKGFDDEVKAGRLTRDQAMERYRGVIHGMRYAGGEYLFVIGMDGTSIANGGQPKQVGTNRLGLKDANGKPITGSFIEALKKADGAMVDYYYPRAGQDEKNAIQKLSWVQRFAPWDMLIGTGVYIDDVEAEFRAMLLEFAGLTLALMLPAVALGFLVNRGTNRSLASLRTTMRAIADGRLDTAIAETGRGDEVGDMARSVEVFKTNAQQVEQLRAEQERQKAEAEQRRRSELRTVAASFESGVAGVMEAVGAAARDMTRSAERLATMSSQATHQAAEVASTAGQTTSNVQAVAAASEELSASIAEITRQVGEAASVTRSAVGEAEASKARMQQLSDSAQKIGEVVRLIQEIAAQTNLLALNATIEAARAGEAGKGFAVVAQEVKALANQTARATEEISAQIDGIQAATRGAAAEIAAIGTTIGRIDIIAGAVAAAIDQQASTTREIARNVQEAARGTTQVADRIASVSGVVQSTGTCAAEVTQTTQGLTRQSERLRDQVTSFLDTVRAA